MIITDIIAALYFGIGCISAVAVLIEFCSIGKELPKGLPFAFLGIMFFGNLILWPGFIPISIKQYREILKHIARSGVGKTNENLKDDHNEQLAVFINKLSKRYPEVSFAKLSRIAVAVSRWEVKRMTEIAEEEFKRAERCKDLSAAASEQENFTFWDGYEACAKFLLSGVKPSKR